MIWWLVALAIVSLALSVLRGAPWLPTRKAEIYDALDLLDLEPGQTVVDLGCGGGGFLRAAAKSGLNAVGYEINPILCLIASVRTLGYRDRVRVVCGDYWLMKLPKCDGVFVFLIEHFMPKLERKLENEAGKDLRVVSYIFKLPSKEPQETRKGMHLYLYP